MKTRKEKTPKRATEIIEIITQYSISYEVGKMFSRNQAISAAIKETPLAMSTFSTEHGYYSINRGKSRLNIAAEIDRLQRVKK